MAHRALSPTSSPSSSPYRMFLPRFWLWCLATGALATILASSSDATGPEKGLEDVDVDDDEDSHRRLVASAPATVLSLIESLPTRQFYIDGSWVNQIGPSIDIMSPSCPSPDVLPATSSCVSSDSMDSPALALLDVTDPSSAHVVAQIAVAGPRDVDRAVRSAHEASWGSSVDRSWSTVDNLPERIRLVRRFLELYEEHAEDLALLIATEMGSPITAARSSHVGGGAYNIESAIRMVEQGHFAFERSLPNVANEQQRHGRPPHTTLLYEPVGVVVAITPWNWPLNQLTLKLIPALLVGCTLVVKPSEEAALSALLLAQLFDEAGFPHGVVNWLNGDGHVTGNALTSHPDVDMISFTGSTRAGQAVAANAAQHLTRTALELGGKGVNIVFADLIDEEWIREVVIGTVDSVFYNSGQTCNAPTRLMVQRPWYGQAIQWARDTAQATIVQSAHHPDPESDHIGPVVSHRQYDRIQHYIQLGLDEGAQLVEGGLGLPDYLKDAGGFYVRPTVFADCTTNMTIMQEEIFGPVICLTPFETEDEAIDMANASPYGLTNYVHSRSLARRRRMARLLRSGMVEMNDANGDEGSPFGGVKGSGYGREGGVLGLEEFCTVKAVTGFNELEDDAEYDLRLGQDTQR